MVKTLDFHNTVQVAFFTNIRYLLPVWQMVRNNFDLILCSHAKWRKTSSPILPDEIIYDILLLLPPDILYNVMKYVCGHWYTIIRDPGFLTKQLMMSAATLLIHMVRRLPDEVTLEHRIFHDFRLLDVTNCDAKLTSFRFKLPCKAKLMSTCNGLLLMDANIPRNLFYVGNPATRRMLPLPPLSKFMYRPTNIHQYCCLAYAASCKVYKVLVVYQDLRLRKVYEYGELISPMGSPLVHEDLRLSKGSPFGCAILTVGIDKEWRVLNLPDNKFLSDNKFLCDQPLSSTGFVYWAAQFCPYILALDVESESIKPIALPCVYDESNYLAPKGNSISFWQVNPDLSMEVWVLKDHKTEEWVKCSYVEGEAIRNELESLLLLNELSPWSEYYRSVHPKSWLGNCEKILFHIEHSAFCRNGRFFVYDLKTHACTDVELKFTSVCGFIPFINSLAWI